MKKKTMKGWVIGLSILATAVAGVSAISIATKGFTDYESMKIKAPGEVVERFIHDDTTGTFRSENEDLENFNITADSELNFTTATSLAEITNSFQYNLSLKEQLELEDLCNINNKFYFINLSTNGVYYSDTEKSDYYGQPVENVELDYFDTIRFNLGDLENDLLVAFRDMEEFEAGEQHYFTYRVIKDNPLKDSYIDLPVECVSDAYVMMLADDIVDTKPTIDSIEFVNLEGSSEEQTSKFVYRIVEE